MCSRNSVGNIALEPSEGRLGGGGQGPHNDARSRGKRGKEVSHDRSQSTLDQIASHGTSHCSGNSETGDALGIAGLREIHHY